MKPIAYLFSHGENKHCYEVESLFHLPFHGYSLKGIIWLRQPTTEERLCIIPCLFPDGFELIAEPFVKDEE